METDYEDLLWLAARDYVWFTPEGEGVFLSSPNSPPNHAGWRASLNVSDTFAYACADAEELTLSQAHEVRLLCEKYGWDGICAWVARKRGTEPLLQFRTENYYAARREIS